MRQADEAARVFPFRLMQAVIDQTAGAKVWLIEARAAGEHRDVDARPVHHPHMRGKISKQWIKEVIRISIVVEAHGRSASTALQQLGRCVMMLEIDDHLSFTELERRGHSERPTRRYVFGSAAQCDCGHAIASRHQSV